MRFAVRLRMLSAPPRQRVFALGAATRMALHRAGIPNVLVPAQATSEGLLALPELATVAGMRIGMVTAPDGRGLLAQRLRERGATLVIAEVYARAPARLNRLHAQRLLEARSHGAVCITSAEALRNVLAALPELARAALLRCVAVVSSTRLDAIARDAGFTTILRADAPTPHGMLVALCAHAKQRGLR